MAGEAAHSSGVPAPPASAPPSAPSNESRCGVYFLDTLYSNLSGTSRAVPTSTSSDEVPTFVDPVEFWPEQLSLSVTVAEPESHHPVYAATVEIAGVGREDSGCAHRFFAWRQLKNDLVMLGMQPELVNAGFPATYLRNVFGISLNEDQQSGRAARLSAWLQRMVQSPDLPQEAAIRLAMFLNVSYTETESMAEQTLDAEAAEAEATAETGVVDVAEAEEAKTEAKAPKGEDLATE